MKLNAVGVAVSRLVRGLFILGAAAALLMAATAPRLAHGQLAPEIGYSLPAGGSAGTTFEMTIGGYDWTPDMQLFAHDPRVKMELIGSPSRVLVPEPPYWFGAKARGPAWPLAREFRAKVTIPADVKPGLVKWQAANANGASPAGWLHVSGLPEFVEDPKASGPQPLPTLPLVVSGQIRKIEEVDRFVVKVPSAGPVTLRLLARQLGSPLHGILRVHDAEGRVVVDVADAEGRDFDVTFAAAANSPYTVSLHDLDFAGDRSYFYRLEFHQGPRVTAAYPATGKRGETRSVEFVGWGVATGAAKLESLVRDVAFPADPTLDSFEFSLATPHGRAPDFRLGLSDVADEVAPPGAEKHALPRVPVAITGALETRFGADTYSVSFTKESKWTIAVEAREIGSRCDMELTIVGPDGKELATADDAAGTTDPQLNWTAPADGEYRLVVTDRSGHGGSREVRYRLVVAPQREDFSITLPQLFAVSLGGQTKVPLKLARAGGFRGLVDVKWEGLPGAVTATSGAPAPGAAAPAAKPAANKPGATEATPAPDITKLQFAADKVDLATELNCPADAPVVASLARLVATAEIGGRQVVRTFGPVVVAVTMKPRIKIVPDGLDDVRKVNRGSTYLAPLTLERLEGYQGPVLLEMTSKQQRHRQGLASDDFEVSSDASHVEYPIFVPEWMETTKTSRMILNGAVRVADPKGTTRTLLQRQELRIGILPEGALLKLTQHAGEVTAAPGGEIKVPLKIARAVELKESVKLELRAGDEANGFTADPIVLAPNQTEAMLVVRRAAGARLPGPASRTLTFRATAMQDGRWPVIAEAELPIVLGD